MLENLTRYLSNITVGEPITFKNLTVFPLAGPALADVDYVTLDEAIASGSASITEISEAGDVPFIRFTNEGAKPVLILDGEELVGAKQNRIVNLTILAPTKEVLDIPVSCVEAGRWGYQSREFASAKRSVYASLRARNAEKVTMNLSRSGSPSADQSEIWADIAEKSLRMKAESPTAAMAQMYESHQAPLDSFAENLRAATDQCGAVFAIQDRIVGFDVFDKCTTLGKLYPKLISSYALDALEADDAPFTVPSVRDAKALIAEVSEGAEMMAFPAVGEGTDVRITGSNVFGAALVAGAHPVHACGFRRRSSDCIGREDHRSSGTSFARASFRRRNRESQE